MNKTIIINISGIIFHIEEGAYELLRNYMQEIKRHFGNAEDSFEIVTDIENRIAELFSEHLAKENKQVINEEDVNRMIAIMGKSDDFDPEFGQAGNATETQTTIKKRLYRNPDDRILGGVCSGIAAYLDMDPIWIRLMLVVSMMFGVGFMMYIILWVIMPEAKSRTEKISMRGEKVNIESIRRSLEAESMNSRSGSRQIKGAISGIVDGILAVLSSVFRIFVKVFVKLAGLFIIVLTAVLTLSLTVVLFGGMGIIDRGANNFFPFNIIDPSFQAGAFISWYFLLAIPVIVILMLGIRMTFNRDPFGKISGMSLLGAWIIALFFSSYFAVEALSQFRESGTLKEIKELKLSPTKTYYLTGNNNKHYEYDVDSVYSEKMGLTQKVVVKTDGKNIFFDDIRINIEKSDGNELKLISLYTSNGKDIESAIRSAENISYTFKQEDSLLIFDKFFYLKNGSYWRNPGVELTLLVPENSKLYIKDNIDYRIYNIYSGGCKRDEASRVFWTMKKDGMVCEKEQETEEQ